MIFHGGYFKSSFEESWSMLVYDKRFKQMFLDDFIKPDFEKTVKELKDE